MLYSIQIEDEPLEIEASDKTNAMIALAHYILQYPTKKITLTYHGDTYAAKTAQS